MGTVIAHEPPLNDLLDDRADLATRTDDMIATYLAGDERFWFAHELRPSVGWLPDLEVLRATATRVLIGVGEDSGGDLCERTSTALATALDLEPTRFPGGHTGFTEDAVAFHTRLREVLAGQ